MERLLVPALLILFLADGGVEELQAQGHGADDEQGDPGDGEEGSHGVLLGWYEVVLPTG